MSVGMLQSLLLCLVVPKIALAACNNSQVIALPVQDVLLSNNEVMRGISLSAGTPPQAFSMMPQPFYNDTWLYNTTATFCDDFANLTLAGCITQRGGLYDESSSSSSLGPATNVYAAGGDPSDTINVIGQEVIGSSFILDTLQVGNWLLEYYPIGMPGLSLNTFYNTQGALGVGSNSTFLNALAAADKIASRSYSWWWGLNGATEPAQMDGQLVLGGFDAAKVSGPKHTLPLTTPSTTCHSGMVVTISDMVLDFPNGTSTSITSPNVLTTCILPDYPLVAYLPWVPYFNTFEQFTGTSNLGHGGGSGTTFQGMLFPTDNVFRGDLTITLDGKIDIRVTNDLLVVPPTNVASDGTIFTNHSVAEVLLGPTAGSDTTDFAILGRSFFQAAYLSVELDTQTFTISQANPVTNSKLVALGPECSSNADSSQATNKNKNSPNTQKGHSSSGTSLPTVDIVGATVAGASLAALVAIAIAILLRRRRRLADKKTADLRNSADFQLQDRGKAYFLGSREAGSNDVLELQSAHRHGELAGYSDPKELSAEARSRTRQFGFVRGMNALAELA